MKIILDETTRRFRIKMSVAEERRLKIDADKRGLTVQESMRSVLPAPR